MYSPFSILKLTSFYHLWQSVEETCSASPSVLLSMSVECIIPLDYFVWLASNALDFCAITGRQKISFLKSKYSSLGKKTPRIILLLADKSSDVFVKALLKELREVILIV